MRATPSPSTAEPTNRAARRAARRGKATEGTTPSRVPPRDGRPGAALTKPAHARTDFAARRSG
ncbi:hypothetical protein [Pseudonocardia xishanensis]|uniref:Uncharacterized protein n=1 Tax=Pseudonocardia xishanensis TaxID=630995 RepID=A0ABP8RX64_9PSEU